MSVCDSGFAGSCSSSSIIDAFSLLVLGSRVRALTACKMLFCPKSHSYITDNNNSSIMFTYEKRKISMHYLQNCIVTQFLASENDFHLLWLNAQLWPDKFLHIFDIPFGI